MFKKTICIASTLILAITTQTTIAQAPMKVYVIQSEPLGFMDASGKPTGIHYEMIQEVSKKTGIAMDVKVVPKNRIFTEIKDGSVDAGIFFPNKDWDEFTVNGGIVEQVKVIALSKKGLVVTQLKDLYASAGIGLMPQMNVTPEFDNDAQLKKQTISDYETMIKMLINVRIETTVGNAIVLYYLLEKQKKTDVVELPGYVLKTIPNQLHISKKSPFVNKADACKGAVEQLIKEGTFDKILVKYAGDKWKKL